MPKTLARISFSGAVLSAVETGLTLVHKKSGVALHDWQLTVSLPGGARPVVYESGRKLAGGFVLTGAAGPDLHCTTTVEPAAAGRAVVVRHAFTNTACRPVAIAGAVAALAPETGKAVLGPCRNRDLRFCHTDNVRSERYPYSQGEYPYVRGLPVEPVLLGRGEDQPFPALYLTDRAYRAGLVLAAAGQERTFQIWEIQASAARRGGALARLAVHFTPPMADGFQLEPGDTLELDGTYFQPGAGVHPQDAFADFLDYAAATAPMRGPVTPMRHEAFFCSWNYGRFDRQNERELLQTARFISRELPRLKYFLVDAGYTRRAPGQGGLGANFLNAFYPDPRQAVDRKAFPSGMKGFAAKIRALGLKPGIWWTPMASLDSALAHDHPDWFLRRADNGEWFRIGACGYLDMTLAPVQQFIDNTLKVVLKEWGMDALKMDFWSQAIEAGAGRVAAPAASALDARRFLFQTVRRHLPRNGVFVTCVAVGMGNPYIGRDADAYRNTIDIGAGHWDEQRENCMWALPTLSLEGRKTFLLNNDSVGVDPAFPDHENFFRLTWCFITMGMQEVGGRLEALPARWVNALRKFTDRCDRGYRCLCADEEAFTGEPYPRVLYVNYPPDSPTFRAGIRQSVALFNWRDTPQLISVARRALGWAGPVRAVDFWTGAEERFDEEFLCRRLDGRSAQLFDIPR